MGITSPDRTSNSHWHGEDTQWVPELNQVIWGGNYVFFVFLGYPMSRETSGDVPDSSLFCCRNYVGIKELESLESICFIESKQFNLCHISSADDTQLENILHQPWLPWNKQYSCPNYLPWFIASEWQSIHLMQLVSYCNMLSVIDVGPCIKPPKSVHHKKDPSAKKIHARFKAWFKAFVEKGVNLACQHFSLTGLEGHRLRVLLRETCVERKDILKANSYHVGISQYFRICWTFSKKKDLLNTNCCVFPHQTNITFLERLNG